MRLLVAVSIVASLLAPPARAARVPLGGIATLELSRGARVVPVDGAQLAALRQARGGATLLFAGQITGSRSRALTVRYEFFRTGHVRSPGALDADALLQALIDAAHDRAAWRPVRWRVPPQWSDRAAQLRWAYDVRSAQTEAVRTLGFAAQLTREGVLLFSHSATDAREFAAADERFRALLATLEVRADRGWLDLREDDPHAPFDASALVPQRGAPPAAGVPVAITAPARRGDDLAAWREKLEKFDWGSLARRVNWVQLMIVVMLLRGLWGFLRRRMVETEEIRMPPEAGRVGAPKPIEPEEPKRRPLG